jgi:hypothetical protein
MFEGNLQACPLSEKDKPIKKMFDEALAADQMIRCERCKRCWFDVELKDDGICKSANAAMGRMTENVQMSLSSIRRRTIWTLVMYQISFLHSIPLRRWLSHGSMFLLTFFP